MPTLYNDITDAIRLLFIWKQQEIAPSETQHLIKLLRRIANGLEKSQRATKPKE